MEKRNTVQKELVYNAVLSLKGHVTAEDVYQYIKVKKPNIGRGTVYRNLNTLADEGAIRRVEIPNGPDRFDFTLENHYHVQCVKCGQVFDVDMDEISDMEKRIKDKHGMNFLSYDLLFKGICEKCEQEEMNNAGAGSKAN